MSHSSKTESTSRLESMPSEILNLILSNLIGTENAHSYAQYVTDDHWPWCVKSVQDLSPSILCANHNLFRITKSYLDDANKWIVIDMDDAFLLLPWILTSMPVIVMDSNTDAAIPEGLLHIRAKLFLIKNNNAQLRMISQWPNFLPTRQTMLIPIAYFSMFLDHLRAVELSHGTHSMAGSNLRVSGTMPFQATQGAHGLTMRVHVQPGAAKNVVELLLENLRRLRGLLNEISIVGAPNQSLARDIEASITRRPEDFYVPDTIYQTVKLVGLGNDLIADHRWRLLHSILSQFSGITSSQILNTIPWLEPPLFSEDNFELVVHLLAYLNTLITDLQLKRIYIFPSYLEFRAGRLFQLVERVLSMENTTIELQAWTLLIFGLWRIFCLRFDDLPPDDPLHLATIQIGLNYPSLVIVELYSYLADEVPLLQANRVLYELELARGLSNANQRIPTLVEWHREIVGDVVSKDFKPVRWLVPRKMIPDDLVQCRILMKKDETMTSDETSKCIVIDAFMCPFERSEAEEWYVF